MSRDKQSPAEIRKQAEDRDPAPKDMASEEVAAKEASPRKREALIDQALEKSFPASDPPSYMGGGATGAPRRKHKSAA